MKCINFINILIESLKRLCLDKSPYVRKTCADVIPFIYYIDNDQFILLRRILLQLLSDCELTVVSSAVVSFSCICVYDYVVSGERCALGGIKSNSVEQDNDGEKMDSVEKLDSVEQDNDGEKMDSVEKLDSVEQDNDGEKMDSVEKLNSGEKQNSGKKLNSGEKLNDLMKRNHGGEYSIRSIPRDNLQVYNSLSFLHPYYYKLCRYLLLMHPFHQTYLIDLLLRYCRMFYKDPLKNEKLNLRAQNGRSGSTDGSTDGSSESGGERDRHSASHRCGVDVEIFIYNLRLLLTSGSYSVVLSSISALYHLTKFTYRKNIVDAILTCLLKSSIEKNDEMYEIFLKSVKSIVIALREDFCPYLSFFFIKAEDNTIKKLLKIDILYALQNVHNKMIILDELLHVLYLPYNSEKIVKKLFAHITSIALTNSQCFAKVMKYIMVMLNSNIKLFSYESILALKKLLQRSDDKDIVPILFFLTKILLTIQANEVKVSILWTLANYQKYIDPLLLFDVARMLVKSFQNTDKVVKMQIIHFVFKIWIYQYAHIFLLSDEATVGKAFCSETFDRRECFHTKENSADGKEQKILFGENFQQCKIDWSEGDCKKSVKNTSVYIEKENKIVVNKVERAKWKEDFVIFEMLCKETFLLGMKDENFDVQDTSKFYANIMLRINELYSNKILRSLKLDVLERDLFNEQIDNYTLPLYFLKFFFYHLGKSIIPNSLQLGKENVDKEKYTSFLLTPCEENLDRGSEQYVQKILQLNTVSNILNKKLTSYVELPDFAENDLPNSEHVNNDEKKESIVTSISSRDLKLSSILNSTINSRIFLNLDDFYKEENIKIGQQKNGWQPSSKSLLINKGTKIQGEDEESEDEEDQTLGNVKNGKSIEEQIDDIENFFFNDKD
ncbi:AP-3 complex subunit beta, putative [Plasmodium ovale curtisi]|uniref:AP-3 complex subunit beta, putative n=1 Tax=Plasmodium ovale curtisi TaxID=864141 RepID=A0A1A8W1C2_PLAOA|nr:AP-3 complex subunit beta, putative [Plasmodium ovale curtisi]